MFTLNEIKRAVCGKDANGNTKALVTFGAQVFDVKDVDKEPDIIAEESTLDAEIKIDVIANYTYVTLIFPNEHNSDLSLIFRGFETYLEQGQTRSKNEETICFISLMPLELGGDAYISCMFPIFWGLEPDYAGGEYRRLRVVFENKNVLAIASTLRDEDLKKIVDTEKFSLALSERDLAIPGTEQGSSDDSSFYDFGDFDEE